MKRLLGWKLMALVASVILVGGLRVGAQPSAIDRKTADTVIYNTLRDVINHGADMYNNGQWDGCYRLYEGALMAVKPFLDHRPELVKAINEGIAKAKANPALDRRAFDLRAVIDRIRAETGGKTAGTGTGTPPPPASKTLWDRLGGETNVKKVVNDFVAAAAEDKEVDFFRGGKFTLDAAGVANLKKQLVNFVSEATGGPYKYTGKSMKEAHKGMGITDAQFDRSAALLKKALEENGAKPADVAAVLAAVGKTRADIVEKKPEPPKDKPADKDKPKDKPEPPKDKPEPPKDKDKPADKPADKDKAKDKEPAKDKDKPVEKDKDKDKDKPKDKDK